MAQKNRQSLYNRRLNKEKTFARSAIEKRIRWDAPVLSQNSKCGISLDLPVSYCRPTSACEAVCYACQGTQNFTASIIKSLAIAKMIDKDPERVARKMIDESQGRNIRIAGSGEILPKHKTLLDYVESFGGEWWGFTKRVETHKALPDLMFSIDATSPPAVLDYVSDNVPVNRRAYMVGLDGKLPTMNVAVTFPTHGRHTDYRHCLEVLETDCPAARKQVAGCWDCGRCY